MGGLFRFLVESHGDIPRLRFSSRFCCSLLFLLFNTCFCLTLLVFLYHRRVSNAVTMAASLCLSAGLCVSWTDLMDRPVIAVNCFSHAFDLCALRAALLPRLLSLLCVRMVSALRFRSVIRRCLPLSALRSLLPLVRDGLGWRWFRFLLVVCKVRELFCNLSNRCTFRN